MATKIKVVKNRVTPYADFIKLQVEINKPTQASNEKQYAKNIIGLDVWDLLKKGEQLQIGEELYQMFKQNKLPLVYGGKSSSNWHYYFWLV